MQSFSTSRRLSNRARDRNNKLKRIAKDGGATLRKGFTLFIDPYHARINASQYGLHDAVADDRLILRMLEVMNDGRTVNIVTSDVGLQVKCRRLGLNYVEPPESLLLEPESNASETKIKELEAEICRIKDLHPNLTICFKGGQSQLDFFRKPFLPDFGDAREEILKLRTSVEIKKSLRPIWWKVQEFRGLSSEEIRRYEEELRVYLESLEQFMPQIQKAIVEERSTVRIELEAKNVGRVPATGIEISIEVDSNCRISEELPNSRVTLPKMPVPPKPLIEKLMESGQPRINPWMGPNPLGKSTLLRPITEQSLKILFPSLRHDGDEIKPLPCFYLTLPEGAEAASMRITGYAENQPVRTKQTLLVSAKDLRDLPPFSIPRKRSDNSQGQS